jgi:VWFA-related protein
MRIWMMARVPNEQLAPALDRYRTIGAGGDFFTVRAIKRAIDGALGSRGAWLLEPYTDKPDSSGLNTDDPADIRKTAELAIQHGYQLCVHAIGDRANRETMNILRDLQSTRKEDCAGASSTRTSTPPSRASVGSGVIAAMQDSLHQRRSLRPLRLGARRAEEGAYVWQKLMKIGAIVGNGTDAPVEDVSPLASFYASVSRKLKDGTVFYPDQRMSREEALKSYTVNNAYAAFEEKLKGSLETGKLADITVLSRDIMTIPEDEIPATDVVYTIVGGKIRFDRTANVSALTRHEFCARLTVAAARCWRPRPTIWVPVRLVLGPTLVLSPDGRVVTGLQPGDFHIFDNDRPHPFTLDASVSPISVAIAVQANQDIRAYLPFVGRVGSALDALLVGSEGESAAIAYGDEVTVVKAFDSGELGSALRKLAPDGRRARAIDAGLRGLDLLRGRPPERSRGLLFIGPPADHGSESRLEDLRREAERDNVTVYALALPEIGRTFVSDTFSLRGLSSAKDRGGFQAGADLARLVPVLTRTAAAAENADLFSVLAAATGGTQLHFRKQNQLEDAIAILGVELHSTYVLSFAPGASTPGYHSLRVEVDVPGAKTHDRPGDWMTEN